MNSELLVLSSGTIDASDRALCNFAGLLGVATRIVSMEGGAVPALPPSERWLALSFATLSSALKRPGFGQLLQECRSVLVYGFSPGASGSVELSWLMQGAAAGVVAVDAPRKKYSVHAGLRAGAFAVCGKSFSVESPGVVCAFSGLASQEAFETCVSVNGLPYAVSGRLGNALLFCLGETCLADVDAPVTADSLLREYYAQCIALSIFLRSVFGGQCWTSPVRAGTMIIDDPWLKRRYGFVQYESLIEQLQSLRCALSIGFIPYNFRRSDPRTVDQLLGVQDRFSIAIHGCDHTRGEFASGDEGWLTALSQEAMKRMELHVKRTRMRFDDVMIFPQGLFSATAMKVLKNCRYLAAVNSSSSTADGERPVRIRDLLDLAVTRYDSFPLFLRRYPNDIFDFAFDALFQKPLLIVQHHEFFRSGYEEFARLVRELSALESNLAWMPLRQALTSSCLMRQMGQRRYEVRFVTRTFTFQNPNGERSAFLLKKPETSECVVGVLRNGQQIPFEVGSGFLSCEMELDPGQRLELDIIYAPAEQVAFNPALKYRGRVFVRRCLCDVRDNYLSRSSVLLSAGKKAGKLMRRIRGRA